VSASSPTVRDIQLNYVLQGELNYGATADGGHGRVHTRHARVARRRRRRGWIEIRGSMGIFVDRPAS
jgi:hypothetical protein